MEQNEKGLKPVVVFGLCGALLAGMLLGSLVIPWMAQKITDLKSPSSSVMGNLIDVENLKDGDGKFTILDYPAAAALEYAELGSLDGLRIEPVEKFEVSEQDIEDNIWSWMVYYGKERTLDSGTAQAGDRVLLDYTATSGGEELSGYKAEGGVVLLAEGSVPDEFLENVAGMSVGSEKTFTASFAEDWPDEEVAGLEDVEFKVALKGIQSMPELTDETINEVTDGQFDAVADFREYIKLSLESMDEDVYRTDVYAASLEAIAAETVFHSMPVELMEWYASVQMYYYQKAADEAETTIEAYLEGIGLGDNPGRVANAIAGSGTEAIRRYAMLTAVAELAGIQVDPDDDGDGEMVHTRVHELIADLGVESEDAMREIYKASNLYNDVRNEKTIDWLIENVRQGHVENSVDNVDNEEGSESEGS